MSTKKMSLKELKNLIKEAIEEEMKEQISGGISTPTTARGIEGRGSEGSDIEGLEKFTFEQLRQLHAKEKNPARKKQYEQAVQMKLKQQFPYLFERLMKEAMKRAKARL